MRKTARAVLAVAMLATTLVLTMASTTPASAEVTSTPIPGDNSAYFGKTMGCSDLDHCWVAQLVYQPTGDEIVVYPVTDGVVGPGVAVPDSTDAGLTGMGCDDAGNCLILGGRFEDAFVAEVRNGVPSAPVNVELYGIFAVDCVGRECLVVGSRFGDDGVEAAAVPVSNGVPGPSVALSPVGDTIATAVDCVSVSKCVALYANLNGTTSIRSYDQGALGAIVAVANEYAYDLQCSALDRCVVITDTLGARLVQGAAVTSWAGAFPVAPGGVKYHYNDLECVADLSSCLASGGSSVATNGNLNEGFVAMLDGTAPVTLQPISGTERVRQLLCRAADCLGLGYVDVDDSFEFQELGQSMDPVILSGLRRTVPGSGTVEVTGAGGTIPTGGAPVPDASPEVPVQTGVVVPPGVSGTVTFDPVPDPLFPAPEGYSLFDHAVHVSGPAITDGGHYELRFVIDASVRGGVPYDQIQVFRNGEVVGDCPVVAPAVACVAGREQGNGGDVVIVVQTSQLSEWGFGPRDEPDPILTTLTTEPFLIKVFFGLLPLYTLRLDATLLDIGGQPVVGRAVRFSRGGVDLCTATTGPTGLARCSLLNSKPLGLIKALQSLKVDAEFAGDEVYSGSSAISPWYG